MLQSFDPYLYPFVHTLQLYFSCFVAWGMLQFWPFMRDAHPLAAFRGVWAACLALRASHVRGSARGSAGTAHAGGL